MLSEMEIKELLNQIIILGDVKIIPLEELKGFRKEALQLSPDPDDAPYVALALKIGCGIWSNDRELKIKIKVIKVYSSKEIMGGM